MQNRNTKEQGAYDELVAKFHADGGQTTEYEPSLAKGVQPRGKVGRLVNRKMIREARKEFWADE